MEGSIDNAIVSIQMNEERFLGLLEKLIGVAEKLQNNPAQGSIESYISIFDKI